MLASPARTSLLSHDTPNGAVLQADTPFHRKGRRTETVLRCFRWISVALPNRWLPAGEYRRSPPVVPLIADQQRYYGGTTAGLPTYPQGWLVTGGERGRTVRGKRSGFQAAKPGWQGAPRCGKPAKGQGQGPVRSTLGLHIGTRQSQRTTMLPRRLSVAFPLRAAKNLPEAKGRGPANNATRSCCFGSLGCISQIGCDSRGNSREIHRTLA
jgi:hypothetical protein